MENKSLRTSLKSKKLASFFEKAKLGNLKPDPFDDYEKSLAEASL